MTVKINGKNYEFEGSLTLEDLLQELKIKPEPGMAVALNETVISKRNFSKTPVQEGDTLEIIHAVAGG